MSAACVVPGRGVAKHGGVAGQLTSTYTTDLAVPGPVAAMPVTDSATGTLVVDSGASPTARIIFGGSTTADQTFTYQVVGLLPFTRATGLECYVPIVLAKGTVTLGALAVGTPEAFLVSGTTPKWADTITDTNPTGYAHVLSPGSDGLAMLTVNVSGFRQFYIQTSVGTATTAAVAVVLGDEWERWWLPEVG